MDLKLKRVDSSDEGIFGELYDSKGKMIAYTAEHAYDGKPKVPVGTYKCVRGMHALSNGVPFSTFELQAVPGHDNILIHNGNWPQIDSHGCILVGEAITNSRQGRMVTQSKETFARFLEIQKGVNEFTLVIEQD